MPSPTLLAPVSEADPCGTDLRWDSEFVALDDAFAAAVQDDAAVVEGEVVAAPERGYDDIVDAATALLARTKDLRVLAIYAEASWRHGGLVAFADALEDLIEVVALWPGAGDGLHPRADEFDGDLGERTAAAGRLLNRIPALAATVGWGGHVGDADRVNCAAVLRGSLGAWTDRVADAFGADPPSATDAWRSLQRLVGAVDAADLEPDGETRAEHGAPPALDAWDLIDQALERIVDQDHHSPALPLLRLLSSWRTLGIIDIVDRMKASGITLEQLMDSVKKQLHTE
ncbi:MAG: type VI secretion system ImpA family N-terminal domain-containing protein [Gammaproteobacteria bacterium]|nr:type VI secretion system ImpA family N-terminal domain-containing protein [Gammaproteobacteria bacterium]